MSEVASAVYFVRPSFVISTTQEHTQETNTKVPCDMRDFKTIIEPVSVISNTSNAPIGAFVYPKTTLWS